MGLLFFCLLFQNEWDQRTHFAITIIIICKNSQTVFRLKMIIFRQVSLQDAGSYYCSGDNGLGHVDKEELILDVQYGPEVTISAHCPYVHIFRDQWCKTVFSWNRFMTWVNYFMVYAKQKTRIIVLPCDYISGINCLIF